jgi:hypothetical protein
MCPLCLHPPAPMCPNVAIYGPCWKGSERSGKGWPAQRTASLKMLKVDQAEWLCQEEKSLHKSLTALKQSLGLVFVLQRSSKS